MTCRIENIEVEENLFCKLLLLSNTSLLLSKQNKNEFKSIHKIIAPVFFQIILVLLRFVISRK